MAYGLVILSVSMSMPRPYRMPLGAAIAPAAARMRAAIPEADRRRQFLAE